MGKKFWHNTYKRLIYLFKERDEKAIRVSKEGFFGASLITLPYHSVPLAVHVLLYLSTIYYFYISTASIFLLLLSFYCFYLYIASIFLLLLSFYCFYLSIASIFILFLSAPLTCTVLDNETGLPCQKKSFPMTIQKVLNDSDRLSFLRCDEPHFQRKIRCLRSRIFCKNNDSVFLHKIT